MFVRTKKVTSRGRVYEYYQLVHTKRVGGKPRQKVLMTLGRVDQLDRRRVDAIVAALAGLTEKVEVLESIDELKLSSSRTFGGVYAFGRLWDELGLDRALGWQLEDREFEFDVQAAVKGMVLNRCLNPRSKLATVDWLKRDAHFPEGDGLEAQHLYRALDFLGENQRQLETHLYMKMVDLFGLDSRVVFYDTTFVETYKAPSTEKKTEQDLVEYGRGRKLGFLVSLAVSKNGFPMAHEVLPGSTADLSTVKRSMESFKERFGIDECIFVGDRGMVSAGNLEKLRLLGYHYIVGSKLRGSKEVREKVLSTPGRYRKLPGHDHLRHKEATIGQKRYIICHNPEEEKRDLAIRESIIGQLEAEIEGLDPDTKKAARLYSHPVKGRYLRRLKDGQLRIDKAKVRQDRRYDGKYVLMTSKMSMDGDDIVKAYRDLQMIERSFRSLKSLQELAPVRHFKDRRIRAHVLVCVLAHLFERLLEHKMKTGGLDITASQAFEELSRIHVIPTKIKEKEWLVRTEPSPEACEIFRALRYRVPSRIQSALPPSKRTREHGVMPNSQGQLRLNLLI